jgi:two-component system cell cycle sensor histidine kinase/response regulator CckA
MKMSSPKRSEAKRQQHAPGDDHRILFLRSAHPMWVFDLRTLKFLDVNDAAVRHYGYSRREFLSMTLPDLHPPEDAAAAREKVLSAGTRECRGCYRHRRRDGSIIEVEITSNRLKFQGREARVAIATDITARRRAEDALREANQTVRALIEAIPLAIIGLDFDGKVTSWNRAAREIFGWTEEEVLGKLPPFIPANDMEFVRANLEGARRGETIAGVEKQRLCKDGSTVDVVLWTAVQRDASGAPAGLISVIDNATEAKRLQEQLRQSQKMEAIGRLAGGVAHDFNNLLTVVTGFSQYMLDSLDLDEAAKSAVEEILKAGNRAASLTNQLLAFGRRQMIQPRVLDLNRVISDMRRMLRRVIIEEIALEFALAPSLWKVRADAGQIEQIMMNLVLNARDAMPQGGRVTIETENLELTRREARGHQDLKAGRHVVIRVSDTGQGMDADTQRHLFEPFFTTKGLGRGTGLGLSTVYGIVKQNGGDIAVASQAGRGSTFTIYLPAVDGDAEEPRAPEPAPVFHGSETILVVEDEPGVRRMAGELLRRQGYTVLEASDGPAALDLAQRYGGPIDVVLTDLIMPQMSGQELARRLTALRPAIRKVFLSGYADDFLAQRGISGAGGIFVQKPFTPDVLARKLRAALEGETEGKATGHASGNA